jgi:hypothetical protein
VGGEILQDFLDDGGLRLEFGCDRGDAFSVLQLFLYQLFRQILLPACSPSFQPSGLYCSPRFLADLQFFQKEFS